VKGAPDVVLQRCSHALWHGEHGESELLDEIAAAKPKVDHTRYQSAEELRENGLDHLRNAMAVLGSKATTEELDEYRRFVLTLAGKVAAAHREHGQDVSPAEAEAIQQITEALGSS
jgi:magnesium-transporting ATPase (P-type)